MKDRVKIFMFSDALGYEIVQRYRFMTDEFPVRLPVRTQFGYSSTCVPTILTGEQPAPVYYRRELQEYPGSQTPDGDKYSYRIHTVDVRISGGYAWAASEIPDGEPKRVLKLEWRMESTYVYHAILDGRDVAGTLHEVWQAQCAQSPKAAAEIADA